MLLPSCPLCQAPQAGTLIWQNQHLRVVWGLEPDHPCLVRVVWQAHVSEMCELSPEEQLALMQAVFAVEAAMKRVLAPKKLNLASLGNAVPHLHRHIVPRWENDAHWPFSIWAPVQRSARPIVTGLKRDLEQAIARALQVLHA